MSRDSGSHIFLRPKPNGEFRMILDLTELKKIVRYEHFKMFNLKTALDVTISPLLVKAWHYRLDRYTVYLLLTAQFAVRSE